MKSFNIPLKSMLLLTAFLGVFLMTFVSVAFAAPLGSTIDSFEITSPIIEPGSCYPTGTTITVTGSATANIPPGQLNQYHVQVNWGDGTVDLETESAPFDDDGSTATRSFSESHTFTTSGTSTIFAEIYHTNPAGEDHEAAESISEIDICVISSEPEADLAITKEVDDSAPYEGDTIVYTITVTNNGPDEAKNVEVTDTLPSGVTFVSSNPSETDTTPYTWGFASIANGASEVIEVTVTVDGETAGNAVVNTAETSSSVNDDDTSDNSDTVRFVVSEPEEAQITVTKTFKGDSSYTVEDFAFFLDGFSVNEGVATTVAPGTYTVTETGPTTEFEVTFDGSCDENGDITVKDGDDLTCVVVNTYTPEIERGTLRVIKIVVGETDTTTDSFSFTINGGDAIPFNNDSENNPNDFVYEVSDTLYTVEEVADDGFTTTYENSSNEDADCDDLAVTDGGTTVCTITNTVKTEEPKVCSISIVSDETAMVKEKENAFAQALSFIHTGWTAVISGATWIWGDDPVTAPTDVDETQTFVNKFGWDGTVDEATLYVASDNSHIASINSLNAGTAPEEQNFRVSDPGGQDEYDVKNLIQQGNNILEVEVTNIGDDPDPEKNPAGVMYRLDIATTDDVECDQPYVEESDLEEITICKKEEGTENPLVWGMNITNGEETIEVDTEAQDGCVTVSVDPEKGPWTVTEDDKTNWEPTHVENTNGQKYYENEEDEFQSGCVFFGKEPKQSLEKGFTAELISQDPRNPEFVCTFTNEEDEPRRTGGGGSILNDDDDEPEGETRGDSDSRDSSSNDDEDEPEGEIAGDEDITPVGAPNTGAGGMSTNQTSTIPLMALFGIILSVAILRVTPVNELR